MAKSAKQAPEEAPAKPKSKMLVIIVIILLLLGIAGGAGWYFTRSQSTEGPKQEAKPALLDQPKFIALQPFTVNLQREDADRYLQVGISLKIYDPSLEDKINSNMPEVRNKLLLLLSSKRASELATIAGKKKLADQIITEVDGVLGIKRPVPQPAAVPASGVAAASSVATASSVASTSDVAAVSNDEESSDSREGIVDVLFTSFIIQ